jgi:uncharacterized protein (TIRG00374 family)
MISRRLNWTAVADAISHARVWPLASGCRGYLAGSSCASLRQPWSALGHLTAQAASIAVVGYATNNLLPLRLGELARVGMLSDRTGVGLPRSVSILVIERVLDAVAILALLLVGVATADVGTPLGRFGSRLALVGLGCVATVFIAMLSPAVAHAGAARVARIGRSRLRDVLLRWTTEFASGIAIVRNPARAGTALGLSLAIWVAEAGLFLFALPALGISARLSTALIALGFANLGILVPSTPAYIGTFEYFASQGLILVGVAGPLALAYAIVVHIAFFIPVTIWGLGVIVWYGFVGWRALALMRQAIPFSTRDAAGVTMVAIVADAAPIDRPSGQLLKGIVEALVPWRQLSLTDAEGAHLVNDTTRFVVGEIDALPVRLRFLFGLGLVGFRAVVRCTTGRGFCQLSLERRRRIVNAWAFGPVAPARQLFRVIRSTALLAMWEAPMLQPAAGRMRVRSYRRRKPLAHGS